MRPAKNLILSGKSWKIEMVQLILSVRLKVKNYIVKCTSLDQIYKVQPLQD